MNTEGEMSEELKPCPFCGDDCACTNWGNRSFDGGVRQVYFIAFCCGQTDDYDTEDEAIAAWNRRLLHDSERESDE